jgi:hypothetical protein
MRSCFLLALALLVPLTFCAALQASTPSGWQQVLGLGPHTRIHVKTDKESVVCFFHSADEQQLTCGRSENIGSPVEVFPRAQIKSIKLSRKAIGTSISTGHVDDLFDGQLIYQR